MNLKEIPKPPNPLAKRQDFAWTSFHPSCGTLALSPYYYLAVHLSSDVRNHCFRRILQNKNPSALITDLMLRPSLVLKLEKWFTWRRAFTSTLVPPFITFTDETWSHLLEFIEPSAKAGWFDEWED